MRFSQRQGHSPAKTQVQLNSIDADLRNALWSAFQQAFQETERGLEISYATHGELYRWLWFEFFKRPSDTLPHFPERIYPEIRKWFFEAKWYELYDFLEFVAQHGEPAATGSLVRLANYVLEREVSGYRLIDDVVTPITNSTETTEIDAAADAAQTAGLSGVTEHLHTALKMLSDRKNPDYRNSVKESISAVESLAKIIAGDSKADLSGALEAIETKTPLHGALRKGFVALYGYTSDQGGIRHALLEAPSVDFVDAKYMLVTCSAFVHFLISRASEAGIRLGQVSGHAAPKKR